VDTSRSTTPESAYIVGDDVPAEMIVKSLQALVSTRRHVIQPQRLTLLDTFDGRIRRAGASVTRRRVNGTAMMAWQTRRGAPPVTAAVEPTVAFVWDIPEGPLQRMLAPIVGVRRLLAQADAEEHGTLLEVLDGQGKTRARLRIESGRTRSSVSGQSWQPVPTVITLTSLRGYADTYERLVPVIRSRPGIASCPEGFHGVMLRRAGALDRADLSLPSLDRRVEAGEGVRRIHLALLGVLAANEPGVRADLDTEFLHDFRVAVRRTRSLLRQVRNVFPSEVVEHFSNEFSWIGRLTGPPRDLDVLLLDLRADRPDLPVRDVELVTNAVRALRQNEHEGLVAALDSARYRRLLGEWMAFLERPTLPGADASMATRALVEIVSQRAWRLSQRLARCARDIDDETPPERLHEVRIHAKKLRYLVDIAPSFYETADLTRITGALKKVQRALGDYNDARIQETRLLECARNLSGDRDAGSAILALGRLIERNHQRRACLREQVVESVARFAAGATQSACRRAFRLRRGRERSR
jgi:CHAD domain-containing protein